MKIIGIIPARLQSTRLKEKMLLSIQGKPLVWYTYSHSVQSKLDDVVIAVDDKRMYNELVRYGCRVTMTSPYCQSGTDRVGEVARRNHADFYINIQGDEPLIQPSMINRIIDYVKKHPKAEIVTLGKIVTNVKTAQDPSVVKIVYNQENEALYFSRSIIPFNRDNIARAKYVKHFGIYCYRKDVLQKIGKLKPSYLEQMERLEQLRFLENGFKINIVLVKEDTIGVDTKKDLDKVKEILATN